MSLVRSPSYVIMSTHSHLFGLEKTVKNPENEMQASKKLEKIRATQVSSLLIPR